MLHRWRLKLNQMRHFWTHTATPLVLTFDACRLVRRPFNVVCKNGMRFLLSPACGDSWTLYEVVLRNDYLRHDIVLSPGDVVLDIGANFGAFATVASRAVGPTGRVLAFEPSPRVFTRLLHTIDANHCNNVEPFRLAIGGGAGIGQLYEHHKSAYSSILESVDGRVGSPDLRTMVPVKTIRDVLDDESVTKVDLMKIDCEGAEYDILDSMSEEIASRVKQIAMEVHRIPGRRVGEIQERLVELGFAVRATGPMVAFNRDWKS